MKKLLIVFLTITCISIYGTKVNDSLTRSENRVWVKAVAGAKGAWAAIIGVAWKGFWGTQTYWVFPNPGIVVLGVGYPRYLWGPKIG